MKIKKCTKLNCCKVRSYAYKNINFMSRKNYKNYQKIYEKFDNKGSVLIRNSLKKSENLLS